MMRKDMFDIEQSSLGLLKDNPRVLNEVSKRMVLRLIPYVFPTSNEDFQPVGQNRHGRVLRLVILSALPTRFLSDLVAQVSLEEMKHLKKVTRVQTLGDGAMNPSWIAERAILNLGNQIAVWTNAAAGLRFQELMFNGAFEIEKLYIFAPSDISEGNGDFYSTTLENLGRDQSYGVKGVDLFDEKLFEFEQLNSAAAQYWNDFKAYSQDHPEWSFWAAWYQGFLDGKPLDWELQRRVALIPDADWDQGPAHIAIKIEEIKAAFLAEKLPLAETVELNPQTGLFRVTPISVQNAALVGALLARVSDALDDAVRGNNGLNANSREVKTLTRAAQRYGNNPQRLEMDFTSVAVGLRRQVQDSGELPASEDNLALLEAVEEGARGLRAAHPDVAANRLALAGQGMRELTEAQRAELTEALPVLVAMSEGDMAEDFAADIPALINDTLLPTPTGAPRLPGMDPAARVFSRISKIALLWDRSMSLGAKWHDSREHKSLKVVLSMGAVTATLYGLVQLGLLLFGVI